MVYNPPLKPQGYKFFVYVNDVGYHKKSMKSSLALYQFWVDQCGYVQQLLWERLHSGVKRYHHGKFIGIREILERISIYCFSNPFSTDDGTP